MPCTLFYSALIKGDLGLGVIATLLSFIKLRVCTTSGIGLF
jgi:hypothetical protein